MSRILSCFTSLSLTSPILDLVIAVVLVLGVLSLVYRTVFERFDVTSLVPAKNRSISRFVDGQPPSSYSGLSLKKKNMSWAGHDVLPNDVLGTNIVGKKHKNRDYDDAQVSPLWKIEPYEPVTRDLSGYATSKTSHVKLNEKFSAMEHTLNKDVIPTGNWTHPQDKLFAGQALDRYTDVPLGNPKPANDNSVMVPVGSLTPANVFSDSYYSVVPKTNV
jgi:hypothetical protein